MKIIKNLFFGLAAVIVLMSLIGLMALPRVSTVERSVMINAPAELIFDQVNDLKKNEAWSPWKDSTMVITYGSISEGKGAQSSWTSQNMGNGTMTIVENVPAQSINIDLNFGAMGTAQSKWTFIPENGAVRVTETMISDAGMNPGKRWMSLMTDKMVGPMFEIGLASLKDISEKRAAELEAEQATQQAAMTMPTDSSAAASGSAP